MNSFVHVPWLWPVFSSSFSSEYSLYTKFFYQETCIAIKTCYVVIFFLSCVNSVKCVRHVLHIACGDLSPLVGHISGINYVP